MTSFSLKKKGGEGGEGGLDFKPEKFFNKPRGYSELNHRKKCINLFLLLALNCDHLLLHIA
jgi:hypothetical protein